MVQRRNRPRLLLEAPQAVGIVSEGNRQYLQRHISQQSSVAGAIHLSHAAGTDKCNDLVRPELRVCREGHSAGIITERVASEMHWRLKPET
jgi:hypothetical protein